MCPVSAKFRVGSRVRLETPAESQMTHRPKPCEYCYKDENNCLSYLVSSQVFRRIESDFYLAFSVAGEGFWNILSVEA